MRDLRNIKNGLEIPTETYADQPYVVQTDDEAWLCVITTGAGHEGQPGQHVVTARSMDCGQTWETPVDVEPADGPEASYAVLLKAPPGTPQAGRVYCFYNHNTDNVREVIADRPSYPDGLCRRVDSLGHFVFKVSDDGGRSWSAQRYEVPQRDFQIDRENPYRGTLKFFWNVGKAFSHRPACSGGPAAYVPLHKVGGFGHGFFTRSEGVLLRSEDLFRVSDPAQATWETLPDSEVGLRAPPGGGPVAEEQSTVVLSDGSFYCVYRTIDGHPACAYSRDGGHTWTEPQYQRFADGRTMKHPRAANFCWRLEIDGAPRYLYWFHNHGGTWYEDRNPVWLCGGIEVDTPEGKVLRWSQPEIVLYDDDPYVRMSYPDLVHAGGKIYLTETQKDRARVHEVDPALLEGLWGQFENDTLATEGLVLSWSRGSETPAGESLPAQLPMPELPSLLRRSASRADLGMEDLRQGFSIDVWLCLQSLRAEQVLLDNRTPAGQGFCLQITGQGTIEIVLNDGRTENRWESDVGLLQASRLGASRRHHVVAIVDGGPKVISFVVDGRLNDGGTARQFGWGRYSPHLRGVEGCDVLRIAGCVKRLRLYNRSLRTSEAIANYKAGHESEA
jgi:hypothetical protein